MLRRSVGILAGVSFLVCVAAVAIAIRWALTGDDVGWRTQVHQYEQGRLVGTFHFYTDIVRAVVPFWLVLAALVLASLFLPLASCVRDSRERSAIPSPPPRSP